MLSEPETVCGAISLGTCFMEFIPENIIYDNSCKAHAGLLKRAPWIVSVCKFVIDRFHRKGHRCGPFHDADMYAELDRFFMSSAEMKNAGIQKCRHFTQFMSYENFMIFQTIRAGMLNLEACFRKEWKRTDTEDMDLASYFRQRHDCSCVFSDCQRSLSADQWASRWNNTCSFVEL